MDERPLRFYRNDMACVLELVEGGSWWGSIGLSPNQHGFGASFIPTRPQAVAKVVMPSCVSGSCNEMRHWLGFEGGYSREKTLETLKSISDQLAVMSLFGA